MRPNHASYYELWFSSGKSVYNGHAKDRVAGSESMRRKREKGYWEKRMETFSTGTEAKARAARLPTDQNVAHVHLDRKGQEYVVSYSVAKWYLEELRKADIQL